MPQEKQAKQVVIIGGGFAGLNAAKGLRKCLDVQVTLVDRRNHHLFQPLLYQVATAGLSPADIAMPIRSILSRHRNVRVLYGEATSVDFERKAVITDFGELSYDYLLLACGARHSYFGHEEWEEHAPGLKTIEQATEIRRRILTAYEDAERCTDPERRRKHLTFVIVGGGPTGVEMAGAIGEMSRFTLARDFRVINSKLARVFLIEAGPRILPAFSPALSDRATRDLEQLGVQVWTSSMVTGIDADGVQVGQERLQSDTVVWAAGVQASSLGARLNLETDRQGRIIVQSDLSILGHPEVFVAGDQAHFAYSPEKSDHNRKGKSTETTVAPLPGLAPVAIQQGRFIARTIGRELSGQGREEFRYLDKGILATIGRNKAVMKVGALEKGGFLAWLAWLFVHVYYLTGFRNRLIVVLQWGWAYLTFRRGARLVVNKEWRLEGKRQQNTDSSREVVND